MAQITGQLHDGESACTHCQRGYGPFNKDMWALHLINPSTSPFIQGYVKARATDFGWMPESEIKDHRDVQSAIMNVIWADQTLRNAITAPTPPSKNTPGVTPKIFYEVCTAWHALQFRKAAPHLFIKSKLTGTLDINPVDHLHSWKAVTWFWNAQNKGQVPKSALKPGTKSTKPIYHTEQTTAAALSTADQMPPFDEVFTMTPDEILQSAFLPLAALAARAQIAIIA